jgi:hypothetical protein
VIFFLSHWFIFNFQCYEECFGIFYVDFLVFLLKSCWHMRCHLMVKPSLPPCPWKCHCVLFLLVWRVAVDDEWFVAGGCFFSIFFSLSSRKKCTSILFFFFQVQSLCFLLLTLVLNPFKKNYVFNLVLKL